jgi:hypothetical protein
MIKVYLRDVNTTTDYKTILKCLIFGSVYFHLITGFDLQSLASVGLLICRHRMVKMDQFSTFFQ